MSLLRRAVLAFASFQFAWASRLQPRVELEVLRPRSGDIIVADDYDYFFNITWTPYNLDYNASVSLRQGPPHELQQMAVINASTINDGYFVWRAAYDDWLRGYGDTDPSSGCNYSIEVNAGGERAMSEYFTVLNEGDGGLGTTVECPSGAPNISDTNARSNNSQSTESTESTNNSQSANNSQNSQDPQTETSSDAHRGFSTAALGGIIAAVAAFFIILFAVAFFVGRRRGWFARGNRRMTGGYQSTFDAGTDLKTGSPASYVQTPTTPTHFEQKASSDQHELIAGNEDYSEYMRLHRKYGGPHMVVGKPVYQMSGNRDGS